MLFFGDPKDLSDLQGLVNIRERSGNVPKDRHRRRIMVGSEKAGLILATAFHANIVRVFRGQVNIKIHR
jgi:hypothetical protein